MRVALMWLWVALVGRPSQPAGYSALRIPRSELPFFLLLSALS